MTSIVDKYYRRIIQNIDNVRMKFDIRNLLIKAKEHDSKINNNELNIEGNLSLIEDYKSNISDNLKLINTNISNISENLELINTNKSNISDILSNITNISDNLLINTNKSNISDNLSLINTNKSNITNNYNISQINKKKSEFNTTLIDNNINNINSIKNDIENYYNLKDIIIIDVQKTNIAETIDINNHKFIIIQSSLNNNFKKYSYLEFDSSILVFFNKHYINIGFFPYIIGIFQ